MIYFSRCRIAYPHDFPDTPCKKCNAFLMIVDGEIYVDKKKLRVVLYAIVVLILIALIYVR